MISIDAYFSLIERLEGGVHESAIAAAAAIAANVGIHVGYGRVRLDDFDQGFDGSVHHAEGRVLRSLHPAHHRSRVLLGEKALGYLDDQHDVQGDGQQQHHQHQAGIVQHPEERVPVDVQHPVKEALAWRDRWAHASRRYVV